MNGEYARRKLSGWTITTDAKFDAGLADANRREHAQIDSRADWSRVGNYAASSLFLTSIVPEVREGRCCAGASRTNEARRARVRERRATRAQDGRRERPRSSNVPPAPHATIVNAMCIARIAAERRGQLNFLVDKRPIAFRTSCALETRAFMMCARHRRR